MNYERFCEKFFYELQEVTRSNVKAIEIKNVPKNNDIYPVVVLRCRDGAHSLIVDPRQCYKDYEEGIAINEIIESIKERLDEVIGLECTLTFNREEVFKHVKPALIGYEKNKEWLKDVPHKRLLDMALIAKWYINDSYLSYVDNQLLQKLNITKEEILQTAGSNLAQNMRLVRLEDIMRELMDSDGTEEMPLFHERGIYVLLAKDASDYGAALIAESKVLMDVYNQIGESFYILPSSVYEVLIIPISQMMEDDAVAILQGNVIFVNEAGVPLQDQLTNSVYMYDGKDLCKVST